MFAVLRVARKASGVFFALLSLAWLSACQVTLPSGGGPSIDTSRPVPVALLVPGGSGQATDASLARALENAARLAMSELDGVQIDLRVYNTGANADQAGAMATQAVADGAKIILGPVYAANANAAGVAVANRNVNVLAFSNNPSIAGGNVFILGPTFQNTANRLVRYAAQQGKGKIMVVHGTDTSETAGRDALHRAIANSSATLAGTVGFELSVNGVVNAVPEISRQVRSTGAQSVFMTSGTTGALPVLTQLLRENSVPPEVAQYVGLQRWDLPPEAPQNSALQNGWFALPDPLLSSQFNARYTTRYGAAPHPIAGLAYDGIAAIGALVKAGQANALTGAALTQAQGFVGVNGIFRLRGDGTNQRALSVAQIKDNQVVIIDPAPRSFAGAGS